MAFTAKVPLDVTKETRGEIVEFLQKVQQSGKWPQQACTTMFFLIPKNVTSERPIALMPTLIRWWEALRAPEVAKWQQKHRVGWDATDGRNGGARQTVWENVMEMERFKCRAGKKVWEHWPCAGFGEGRSCGCFVGTSSIRGECSLKGVWWSRSRPSRLSCLGQSGVGLLLRVVLQDAMSEVTKFYPPLKLRVFVDDITALLMVKKQGSG